jgi:hypothetical protein
MATAAGFKQDEEDSEMTTTTTTSQELDLNPEQVMRLMLIQQE